MKLSDVSLSILILLIPKGNFVKIFLLSIKFSESQIVDHATEQKITTWHNFRCTTFLNFTVAQRDIETKRHLTYFYFLITQPPSNVKKVSEKNLVDRHPFLGMAAQIQPRQHRLGTGQGLDSVWKKSTRRGSSVQVSPKLSFSWGIMPKVRRLQINYTASCETWSPFNIDRVFTLKYLGFLQVAACAKAVTLSWINAICAMHPKMSNW